MKCMTIHLAFDNRSIKKLLSPKNRKYFSDEFPIFYQNRDKRTAIDVALDRNQIKSVDLMLDYIVHYQNSYVYSYIFKYNLIELLEKNVMLTDLMESKIINYTFDFDEWPGTSDDTQKMFGAYSDSIFRLRKKFKYIYPQLVPENERFDDDGNPIPIFGGIVSQVQQRAENL